MRGALNPHFPTAFSPSSLDEGEGECVADKVVRVRREWRAAREEEADAAADQRAHLLEDQVVKDRGPHAALKLQYRPHKLLSLKGSD